MNSPITGISTRGIYKLGRLFHATRPLGVGLIIYMLLNVAILLVVIFNTPLAIQADFDFERVPPRYSIQDGESQLPVPKEQFPGCDWLALDKAPSTNRSQAKVVSSIRCDEHEARKGLSDEPGGDYPLHLLSKRFESDPSWAIAEKTWRTVTLPPNAASMAWTTLLVLPISLLLAGRLNWAADARRGLRTIATRPWLLLAVPVVGVSTFQLFNLVMPFRIETATQAAELFRAAVPSAWLTVFLIPLAEEAVFRQWIYVRVIGRLPVWAAAIGTSWVFMLAHVFNPQVTAMPAYLPTMFALGLVLFWLRHRYGTLTLPLLAHISYNGLLVGLAG